MKTVQYVRVSTVEQNPDRQLEKGIEAFIDKVSGSVKFQDRPGAKKLIRRVEAGEVDGIIVHSIDRLGRNTLDILHTIQYFTSKGVNIKSRKEGLQTFVEGKENPVAKMIVSIMASLSEFELERIRERQLEGIKKAREKGVYKTNGGKPKETVKQFMSKPKIADCRKELLRGESIRRAAKLAGVSLGTAQKVKRLMEVA